MKRASRIKREVFLLSNQKIEFISDPGNSYTSFMYWRQRRHKNSICCIRWDDDRNHNWCIFFDDLDILNYQLFRLTLDIYRSWFKERSLIFKKFQKQVHHTSFSDAYCYGKIMLYYFTFRLPLGDYSMICFRNYYGCLII